MKLGVLAALLLCCGVARADEPPGASGSGSDETAPAVTPHNPADDATTTDEDSAAESPPASTAAHAPTHARLSMPTFHALSRTHVDDDGESKLEKKEDVVLGGKHWRIKTPVGAVHVWVPPGYDRSTAGTVVYVHGYYTDADGAWRDHDLARQFKASHQNAMFIVPDAPSGNDEAVQWPALTHLRRAVTRANLKLPDGPVIVMGHSGAFRTVMQWVDHRLVDQIILLDALYAGESAFDEFIASGKRADDHKLIVVAANTAEESSAFAHKYKFAVAREKIPGSVSGFTKRERGAKLLYIRSQFEHMAIVTSEKVIPLLLRVTPLHAIR
ncbi:MAG TPA: hypothetical protein VGM88_06640 [Kofleriaceae bacterium]|jgi:hypothetical protein